MGATPDVIAPAGHGFAHDSQPAGHVTAVVQSTGAAAEVSGAAVTAGADDSATALDADHIPLSWAAARVERSESEIKASMHWEVV